MPQPPEKQKKKSLIETVASRQSQPVCLSTLTDSKPAVGHEIQIAVDASRILYDHLEAGY